MQSFLHENCKSGMCEDCISIAQEYQELEQLRKQALYRTNQELATLKSDLRHVKRRAEMFEQVAKAGVGEVISAWIDQEIYQIIEKENAK